MRRSVLISIFALAVSATSLLTRSWAQAPAVMRPPLRVQTPEVHVLTEPPPMRVISMKLLAPEIGWTLVTGRRLLWTEDGGMNWKEITPPIEDVAHIFFIDTQRGWATSKRNNAPMSDDLKLDLALTADAGASWSVTHVTLPLNAYGVSRDDVSSYEGGPITFADELHGWMGVQIDGRTIKSWWNFLLVTSDGGRTWRRSPETPLLRFDPEILLASPADGFMVGGQDVPAQKLYATHDGAKSWKEISLAAPKEILPADQPTYDLPVFEVADHGYEAVTYTGSGGKSASVLWATADGGRTWNVDEIVRDPETVYWGKTLLSALYGLKPAEAMVLKQHLMLSALAPAVTIKANVPAGAQQSDYFRTGQLSIVQPSHAWGIAGDGQLLSTTNSGGGNWTDITPGTHPHIPWLVGGMKMVAPGKGWVITDHGLFWTENGGKDWKNITPRSSLGPDGEIKDIFFLDTRHGWVLFAKYDEPEPKFDLSYTDDSGATWSTMHVHVDMGNLAAGGRIAFADTRHGWMVLDSATSSARSAGALFLTADGGRTWRNSPDDPGGQGPILLVTPREGWLVGNGEDDDLHVTRDGAKSWQTVSFPAPKEIYPAINPTADVPVFMDKRHGFVSVTYSGPHDANSAVVLFATGDGGRTWKADRILTNLESGFELSSTVVDSNWITARVSAYQPSLTVLNAGARVRASNARWSNNTGYSQILQLSFVTPKQGWVIQDSGHEGTILMRVGDGDLLSTTDGGATWTNITPGPKRPLHQ